MKRLTTSVLALCIVINQLLAGIANAQFDGPDFESPVIEHEQTAGGRPGAVEIFDASVVDNDELVSVRLFYRFEGETEYVRVSMRQVATSSNYTARVNTASMREDAAGIEYYIRAEDAAGNLVLKGFAFQPLVRTFEVEPIPATVVAEEEEPAGKVNWLYVALGVLVVGGIAAAAGGGGGSKPQPAACDPDCNVTVTINAP